MKENCIFFDLQFQAFWFVRVPSGVSVTSTVRSVSSKLRKGSEMPYLCAGEENQEAKGPALYAVLIYSSLGLFQLFLFIIAIIKLPKHGRVFLWCILGMLSYTLWASFVSVTNQTLLQDYKWYESDVWCAMASFNLQMNSWVFQVFFCVFLLMKVYHTFQVPPSLASLASLTNFYTLPPPSSRFRMFSLFTLHTLDKHKRDQYMLSQGNS